MFDRILFEKICNVTCTWDELKRFNSKIDEKDFDIDDCFKKYYSINSILKCIELYNDKRISDKYFSYWCNAYNWIIMGGFKGKANDENVKNVDLETILIWDISDWLDSLSFFDEEYDDFDLGAYVDNLRVLDSIYNSPEQWDAFYSFGTDTYDSYASINDIIVLLINKIKNVYYTFVSDGCDFKDYILDEKLIKVANVEDLINDLKIKGYKNLN